MHGVSLRAHLLGGCSVLCLTLGMAHPTLAQDRRPAKSVASFYERFHVSLEGGWLVNESGDSFAFASDMVGGLSLPPGRNGGSAGAEIGGAFNPLHDWRLRWRGNFLGTAVGEAEIAGEDSQAASARTRLRFHTFDGEFGYRPEGSPLRLFAGARVLRSHSTARYNYQEESKFGFTTTGQGTHEAETFGIGPRAGLELTVPFPDRRAFATLNGSVAAIFAKQDHGFSGAEDSPVVRDFSRSVTIFNTEATASLGYRFTDRASLELGYRVQYFTNMVPAIRGVGTGAVSGTVAGNRDILVHGPIGKLTIAWP